MMTLANAAAYFDRTPVLDPDSGRRLFDAQVDPYDDSRRDAGAAYRRVLSVAPGTKIPAARSVRIFGQTWIVGGKEVDGLAEAHREKYVLQRADTKLSIYRLPSFLSGAAASATWASVEWLKDVKQIEVDSRMPEQCNVYVPATAAVQPRDVVAYSGSALLVLETHDLPSGYTAATSLRLDQAVPLPAVITPRTYVPTTGAFTAGAAVTVQGLRVRWQSLFEYGSQADARYQEGDCSLVLPEGTALTTRDRIDFDGVVWQVVSKDSLAGAVVAHARRA